MFNYHVAVIDDNRAVLKSLKLVLERIFSKVTIQTCPQTIPALLSGGKVDVILLDMNFNSQKLDGKEGMTWLRYIKEQPEAPAVVLITAFGDINLAVNSLKEGAEDFITKPWNNDILIEKLLKAIETCNLKHQNDLKMKTAEDLISKREKTKRMTLDEMEKQHIMDIMEECGYNISEMADLLDVSRQTLYNKMKKFGMKI